MMDLMMMIVMLMGHGGEGEGRLSIDGEEVKVITVVKNNSSVLQRVYQSLIPPQITYLVERFW